MRRRKSPRAHLLSLRAAPAIGQDRAEVGDLARSLQEEEATAEGVDLALVDWDYTGEEAASDAEVHDIRLEVVKHPLAKKGSCPCRAGGWSSAPLRG